MAYIEYNISITWDYAGPINLENYYLRVGQVGSSFHKHVYGFIAYCGSEYTIGEITQHIGYCGSEYFKGNAMYVSLLGSPLKETYYYFVNTVGSPYNVRAGFYAQNAIVVEKGYNEIAYYDVVGSPFHLLSIPKVVITYACDSLKRIYVSIEICTRKDSKSLEIYRRKITSDIYEFVDKVFVSSDGWVKITDNVNEYGLFEYKIVIGSTGDVYTYYVSIPEAEIFKKPGIPNFTYEKICV